MNPDVVRAISRLRADNVLSAGQAALFDRVARRGLVSVRFEIRALLYAGVLLLTSGVGVLVAERRQEIGPLAIATGIASGFGRLPASGSRAGPHLSRGARFPPRASAFDYVLLLGLLLFASDLAYVEAQFTVLGPRWPHHLLIVGVVYLLVAYRWDSRTALGLVARHAGRVAWPLHQPAPTALGPAVAGDLRPSAIVLGTLYVASRRALGAARAEGPLRGDLRHRGAAAAAGRAPSGVLHDLGRGARGSSRCWRWRAASWRWPSASAARCTSRSRLAAAYIALRAAALRALPLQAITGTASRSCWPPCSDRPCSR